MRDFAESVNTMQTLSECYCAYSLPYFLKYIGKSKKIQDIHLWIIKSYQADLLYRLLVMQNKKYYDYFWKYFYQFVKPHYYGNDDDATKALELFSTQGAPWETMHAILASMTFEERPQGLDIIKSINFLLSDSGKKFPWFPSLEAMIDSDILCSILFYTGGFIAGKGLGRNDFSELSSKLIDKWVNVAGSNRSIHNNDIVKEIAAQLYIIAEI